MDNSDTCSVKDKKNMDVNTVWQWRIMHVKKYSRNPKPFHYSNKIGLDFNVASNTQKKLDLQLATNGVMFEICDFAETVNESKGHFITNILENNFDLGLGNEQQRVDFTAQILHKVRDLISNSPVDKHEVFSLFETSSKPECTSNNELNMASTECEMESFLMEVDDTDQSDDKFKCSEATSKYVNTESNLKETSGAHADDSEHEFKCVGAQSTKELKDVLSFSFPYCEEIGLNLGIGSKQSLDPGLFTKGAMLELVHFTRVLTSSYSCIVLDVLDHNFDLDLKNPQVKNQVLLQISHVLKKRKQLTTTASRIIQNSKDEPLSLQTRQTQTPRNVVTVSQICDIQQEKMKTGNDYTCPVGESDLDSDPDSGNTGDDDHLQDRESCSLSSDIPRESKSSRVDIFAPILTSNNVSSSIPTLDPNMDLPFENQNVKKVVCGEKEQTQTRNAPKKRAMKPEIGTEHMWKLRANHIQRILSIPHEEHCPLYSYSRCKKLGIDFNVGSGVKQNLDPKLLTNGIMVELNTFAKALESASKHFITEILEYNFDLNLKDELYRSAFARKILGINTIKLFCKRNKEKPFELPDMTSIQTTYCPECRRPDQIRLCQNESQIDRMNHSHPPTMTDAISAYGKKEEARNPSSSFSITEKTIMDTYPLCKKIGLNLCVRKDQPKDKLDLHALTNGIMMEVSRFAKRLCGFKSNTIVTLLEHNFNFDFPIINASISNFFTRKNSQIYGGPAWPNKVFVVRPVFHEQPGHANEVKHESAMHRSEKKETIQKTKAALQMKERAKLPSRNKKVIKSKRNHPSARNGYPNCTEIGLKLYVTSNSGKKGKLNLHHLTRAVVLEIHKFASQKVGLHYLRTVFDILDYNFDLSSQHYRRWEFSIATAAKIQTMAKQYSEQLEGQNEVFTLPFECDFKASKRFVEDAQNKKSASSSLDIASESELSCSGISAPVHISADISSNLPSIDLTIDPPFASQLDEKGLCRGEEQTLRYASNEHDMEQEEMATEHLWKLRTNRVEHILSAINKEFRPFKMSKKVGLEYNVRFGPKQNLSIKSLTHGLLREIARFASAINSSQKAFIMEILEYNFDLGLQSQHDRNIFACEIMNRVTKLSHCEDAIKFSNKLFELPGPVPSINQSAGIDIPELSNILRTEKYDVAPACPPDSHTESKEHISCKSVELYPWCKEIGLKLNLNSSQPPNNLETNKLTNGAMTEVTSFAEKLCGTYEQICLDILRHNFDLDLQSADSDLARNILAQIPAAIWQKNLSSCTKDYKTIKGTQNEFSTMEKLDCQNKPNLDECIAGSSQKAITDRLGRGFTDIEQKNELNLELWKLRANHIQRILSLRHEEHCPLYSYSRCKKLGIDFNVGSEVKQNLDPKLLTNGVMVELKTFAKALKSASKHFVTEILEYNFDLNLKDELYRSAFTHKIQGINAIRESCKRRAEKPFELPDVTSIREPIYGETMYCPQCHQDQIRLCQNESQIDGMNRAHPPTMTDTISAYGKKEEARDPSSSYSIAEKTIMDVYPLCKKIGLNLCVRKDQPKDKLDPHVLTNGIMMEVSLFAKRLCGWEKNTILTLLEHNFNFDFPIINASIENFFNRKNSQRYGSPAWLDTVFDLRPVFHRQPGHANEVKHESAMHRSEKKETIQKTKPAHKSALQRHTKVRESRNYPTTICSKIGLDLDMKKKRKWKKKLPWKLLTNAVVVEIHRYVIYQRSKEKKEQCFQDAVFDILNYNFDLSSLHHRRWRRSITIAPKIRALVKRYHKQPDIADEVFKLPSVKRKRKLVKQQLKKNGQKRRRKYSQEEPDKKRIEDSWLHQVRDHSDFNSVNHLGGVESNREPWTMNVQTSESEMNVDCHSPLQGNIQMKEEYDSYYGNINPEQDTEEKYHPCYDVVKTESNSCDVEPFVAGETAASLGYPLMICPNIASNIKTESQNEGVQYYILNDSQRAEGHAMLVLCPNIESNIKPELERSNYLLPVVTAPSQICSIVNTGQGNESTLIKEEQENMPADSYCDEGVTYTCL